MGFLKKIAAALFGSPNSEVRDRDGIYLYVKCGRCGAPVRIRADKHHDLQRDYETNELVLHKEIMDGTCFRLMQATVRFSPDYRIIDRQLEGGEFISWEEYHSLTTPDEDSDREPESEENPRADA